MQVLVYLPAVMRSAWSKFKACNWLLSIPWPGGCDVSHGEQDPGYMVEVLEVCVCAHMRVCVCVHWNQNTRAHLPKYTN